MTSAITHFSCELLSDISQFVTVGSIGEVCKNIRIYHGHHEACRLMTNSYPEGQTFSNPHTNNGLLFLLTIKYPDTYLQLVRNDLRDNCIRNVHLGRYTVRNLVLWRNASGAIKHDFRPYINQYTTTKEILNLVMPVLLHLCSFVSICSVARCIKWLNISMKSGIINDIK